MKALIAFIKKQATCQCQNRKRIGRRLLSLLLCTAMLAPYTEELAVHAAAGQPGYVVLESGRIPPEKLPGEDCIYLGTASAQVEERGEYAVRLYREGSLSQTASVDLRTIDLTAVYGKDYELVMDDVEETGDGTSILEKYVKGQSIQPSDKVRELLAKPSETQGQVQAVSAADKAGAEAASNLSGQQGVSEAAGSQDTEGTKTLAQVKEEQTKTKARKLQTSDNGQQTLVESLSDALIADSMKNVEASSRCTVQFAAGESEKTVRFRILEDKEKEGNEGFSLLLADPVNVQLFEVTACAVTIQDDEPVEHSKVSFTERTYQAKDGKAALTVKRVGAEYSVCDMAVKTCEDTAHAGTNYEEKNETLAFAPYETEKKIELDVSGEGRFGVMLTDLRACTEGEYTKAFVELQDGEGGKQESGKKETAQLKSAAGTKAGSKEDTLSFSISVNNKPYTVEYAAGDAIGRIMDYGFQPAVQVGTYYFALDDVNGGMFKYGYKTGNQPGWRGNVRSEYLKKEQFGKLEYYSSLTSDKGGAYTESIQPVPGVYFQYFVNDWRSKSKDFGGQRARLEIIGSKSQNVDGKFDRSQEKGVIANSVHGDLNANLKFKVWALDEESNKTPKSYVEFYGLCAMNKKYNISLLPAAEKKFRTGTKDSSQSVVPVQVSVKCGAVDVRDNQSREVYASMDQDASNLVFSISDTQIGGRSGKFGHITGYQISVDPSSASQRRQVSYPEDFIKFLNQKKGSGTATGVDFRAEAVEAEIKKVNANLDTVPYDAYFISWIDQVQADVIKEGVGYKQALKFTPRLEYNDVKVEVLAAKGKGAGHFKDTQLAKNGKYTFHAGDSLDLEAVADDPDRYHVVGYEVSDNQGITYNTITDGSYLFLESFKSYQIRPVVAANDNAVEIRFTDKEAENGLEVQGLISQQALKGTAYEGKHLLNLNPGAKTVEEMMKPVPGKDYSISIVVKDKESGGYIRRPQVKLKSKNTVYHTQLFFMAAAADTADNIVEIGLSAVKQEDAGHDYDISGNLVSAFAPIRSNGEAVKNLPVSNYTMSVGNGGQNKDSKTGKMLVESAASLTGGTGQYSLRVHGGCDGDIIPMLVSNGLSNGQVVDVKLTNTKWSSQAFAYQVDAGNTELAYPYHMPQVSSITYSYNNSANNQKSDNRENSVCIYDDTLNISAKVNKYDREVKEAVFTVYTVTGQKTEYKVKESEDNRNTFVCTIPKMTENLHNGDRIMVRLVDQESLFSGAGDDNVFDDAGEPITGQSVPIQYPDVDTGLVFYVENTIVAPQSYDLENSLEVDVPLIGKSTANANSGLITFGKTNWPGNTGYTLQVGLDMLYSTIATPNTAQKVQNYNNFYNTVKQASEGKTTNAEDIIYQQTQKDKKATLGNVS